MSRLSELKRRNRRQRSRKSKKLESSSAVSPRDVWGGYTVWHAPGLATNAAVETEYVGGRAFYHKAGMDPLEVVLLEPFATIYAEVHRITEAVDSSMFRFPQRNPSWNSYWCSQHSVRDMKPENFVPNIFWSNLPEGMELTVHGHTANVIAGTIFIDSEEVCDVDPGDDGLWLAEEHLKSLTSCAFCAQVDDDFSKGVPRRDRNIRPAYTIGLIPMFGLNYCKLTPSGSADEAGRIAYAYGKVGNSVGVSLGWGWIETPLTKSSKSSRWQTHVNYLKYVNSLHSRCSSCLEDGKVVNRRSHKVLVESVSCPHCEKHTVVGGVTLDSRGCLDWPEFRQAELDENGFDDPDTAGLFQLCNTVPMICEHCGEFDFQVPELSCSSCDNPTPIQAHQVVTVVTKSGAGFYEFRNRDTTFDIEGLRSRKVCTADVETIDSHLQFGLDKAMEGKLREALNLGDPAKSIQLWPFTVEDQMKLIGSTILA